MNTLAASDSTEPEAPSRAEVEAALNAVLSQPEIQASTRLCEFLRFIVYEALEGRAGQLKAFTIAVAVYGRDENFDAQSSSIVRVEATRLRRLLDRYYSGEGAGDPVRIQIPRGGYAPEFVYREVNDAGIDIGGDALPGTHSRARPVLARLAAGLAGLALVAASGAAGYWAAREYAVAGPELEVAAPAHHQPTIAVEVLSPGDKPGLVRPDAIRERLAVEHALEGFENILVLDGAARQNVQPDYRLQIVSGGIQPASRQHIVRVIHSQSGAIIWSYPASDLGSADGAVRNAELRRVATAVGRPFGIVFSDQQRRLPTGSRTRYACVIASYDFLARPSQDRYVTAKSCLRDTLAKFPDFGAGASLLALLTADGWRMGFENRKDVELLDELRQLAHRAQLASPASPRSTLAVFDSELARGNFREAFSVGERMLETEPDYPIAKLRLAAAYVMRDDLDRADALYAKAFDRGVNFASVLDCYRFLLAYRKGDKREAERWAAARGLGYSPLGLIARIIVNHQSGRIEAAKHALERLRRRFPAAHADIPAMLDRHHASPALRASLLRDLKATGLFSTFSDAGFSDGDLSDAVFGGPTATVQKR